MTVAYQGAPVSGGSPEIPGTKREACQAPSYGSQGRPVRERPGKGYGKTPALPGSDTIGSGEQPADLRHGLDPMGQVVASGEVNDGTPGSTVGIRTALSCGRIQPPVQETGAAIAHHDGSMHGATTGEPGLLGSRSHGPPGRPVVETPGMTSRGIGAGLGMMVTKAPPGDAVLSPPEFRSMGERMASPGPSLPRACPVHRRWTKHNPEEYERSLRQL